MKGRLQFWFAKFEERSYGTLLWMSTLAGVEKSYRNKLILYLSQIKPHLIIISELSCEKSQKRLSVQVARLFFKVFCLHLYTHPRLPRGEAFRFTPFMNAV